MTSEPPQKKVAKVRRSGKSAAVQASLDFDAGPEAVPGEAKKLKTSAPGQSLGFSLQQTRIVARLLEADAGDVVSLEVFDDVGVEKADGTVIAEQGKSTLGYNPLTDRSPPFWKTVANWLDAIAKKVLDVNVTWFEIYVSRNVAPGGVCKSFNDANDAASALTAVAAAKALLWGTAPEFAKRKDVAKELAPQLQRVFDYADADVAAMIARMRVVLGSGNPHEDIEPLLKKKLVSDDGYENVVRWTLGWVKKETDLMIQRGEPARISYDIFHAALLEYVRLHDRNTALRSVAGMPAIADVERELAMRTYVDQLDLVNTPDEDVFAAITDYLRASTDRTHWAEKGFIDEKALDAFADELEVVWRNHKRKLDIVHKSSLPPERGLLIFTECNGHTAALSGLSCPAHFTRGSFHALADMERIGWHPDYLAELKRLRDERAAETSQEGGDNGASES